MREIEFRGRVKDEPDEFVYGLLVSNSAIHQLKETKNSKCCGCGVFNVYPESIGQYTGCRDHNKIKIYEHDIVKDRDNGELYEVIYHDCAFCLFDMQGNYQWFLGDWDMDFLDVVGNTHEIN